MSLSAIVRGSISQNFGHYHVRPVGGPGYANDLNANPVEPKAWIQYDGPHNPTGAKRAKLWAAGTTAPTWPDVQLFDDVHMGVDIACPIGTAIRAPGPGRVRVHSSYQTVFQGKKVWGLAVVYELDDGRVLYVDHLSKFSTAEGARLRTGGLIARSGNSGASFDPHAHVEAWAKLALFFAATRLNPNRVFA